MDGTEYLENPGAPLIRVHKLESVDFIGSDGVFTTSIFKRSSTGVWYRETACWIEMPISAIAPAVAMTASRLSMAVVTPISNALVKSLRMN